MRGLGYLFLSTPNNSTFMVHVYVHTWQFVGGSSSDESWVPGMRDLCDWREMAHESSDKSREVYGIECWLKGEGGTGSSHLILQV